MSRNATERFSIMESLMPQVDEQAMFIKNLAQMKG